LSTLNSSTEFFSHDDRFRMTANGHYSICDEIEIHPRLLKQMSYEEVTNLLECCSKVTNGEITFCNCKCKCKHKPNKEFKKLNPYRLKFIKEREKSYRDLKELYKVENLEDVVICGIKIFKDIKPHEVDRLYNVVEECNRYDVTEKCFKFGHELATALSCTNITDYCAVVDIARCWLINKVKKTKKLLDELFNESKFKDTLGELRTEFEHLVEECRPKNEQIHPGFSSPITATTHYMKHSKFGDEQLGLTVEKYFEIAGYISQLYKDFKPIWTQDGSSLKYEIEFVYEDDVYFAVMYDKLDEKIVIASVRQK